jgi:hypothetical protein
MMREKKRFDPDSEKDKENKGLDKTVLVGKGNPTDRPPTLD